MFKKDAGSEEEEEEEGSSGSIFRASNTASRGKKTAEESERQNFGQIIDRAKGSRFPCSQLPLLVAVEVRCSGIFE